MKEIRLNCKITSGKGPLPQFNLFHFSHLFSINDTFMEKKDLNLNFISLVFCKKHIRIMRPVCLS